MSLRAPTARKATPPGTGSTASSTASCSGPMTWLRLPNRCNRTSRRRCGGPDMAERERRDDSLQTTLRAQGYRLTPQRQLVLRAVTELRHGTPDEICLEVQRTAAGVNISTVYRTLELLEELGLVT